MPMEKLSTEFYVFTKFVSNFYVKLYKILGKKNQKYEKLICKLIKSIKTFLSSIYLTGYIINK